MATTNDPPASPRATSDGMAMFGQHVVALIDLLGQTHILEKWNYVPKELTPDHPWIRAVRESVGVVESWRDDFELRFDEFQANYDELAQQASIGKPEQQRRLHEEYRKSAMYAAHFSDTMIFYSPLQNEHGFWQMTNVIKMIVASGALLLAGLNSRRAFRGAVDVGMLTRLKSGDPYGPAMARAHYLESKAADYPRMVVGPGVLSYLDAIDRTDGSDAPIQAIQALAGTCRTFLAREADGCWIVDYLNDAFANAGGDAAGWRRLQADGRKFVEEELTRFKELGDTKLTPRYERLAAYFKSHEETAPGIGV